MDITTQIEAVLEQKVRPVLHGHSGDVTLLSCTDGVVHIELLGACSGCPSADLSTRSMIEELLRDALPELERVEVEHPVSRELLEFARQLLHGKESQP